MHRASVLFVCLGNICRSPLAEAALRAAAERSGMELTVDSAGTGDWHVGMPPDPRALAEALRHGIDISAYRARQVSTDDFDRFTHIFALDHQNFADLQGMAPVSTPAQLSLLLDVVPGRAGQSVADPYFGGEDGFVETWRQVSDAAEAILGMLGR